MKKGTIVLTPFPFTDLAGQKNRPALVLALSRREEDVILAFISSGIREAEETDLLMLMEHPDFAETGLKKIPSSSWTSWPRLVGRSSWDV